MFSYFKGKKSHFLSTEVNQCQIRKSERIKKISLNKGKE